MHALNIISFQVKRKVYDGYAALDALLNPAPPHGSEDQVRRLAEDYASRNDWIHLVYVLDEQQEVPDSLYDLVPVLDLKAQSQGSDPSDKTPDESRAATPSPRQGDPTPMPTLERKGSYFSRPLAHATSSDSLESGLAAAFIRAIGDMSSIADDSIAKFVSWRTASAVTPLESSVTSASSSNGAQPPMPTVARASGGGEWEASLSRRVASAHAHAREKERRSRLKKKEEKENERVKRLEHERRCGPLFPRSSRPMTLPSSTGIRTFWTTIFGPKVGVWKWGVVAAVALAVGWGCWAGSR